MLICLVLCSEGEWPLTSCSQVTPLAIPLPKGHNATDESIDDISLLEDFDKIFGLTEDDIAHALRLVNPQESVVRMHLELVRQKLNRYRPTPTSQATLYNTTAALDYLEARTLILCLCDSSCVSLS